MNAPRSNARLPLRWRLGKPAALVRAAAGIIESLPFDRERGHPDHAARKAPH